MWGVYVIIIIIIINPLTARVVGAPQTTSPPVFLHPSPFSTALWDLANSRPDHPLMLSAHLVFCLPRLLPPFPVPCELILARPDELETGPYHFSLPLFTMVRSACGPIACWILARTSSLLAWSLYEMRNAAVLCAILKSTSGWELSSVTTERRHLKLVTVSSVCPFTLTSVLMTLVLFVISLVFLARISMP